MSLPVHLVPSLEVAVGDEVSVEGDEAHHAVAVRRLRVGEQVVLTDGRGTSVVGPVTSTGKRVFTVAVASVEHLALPVPVVTVVQAIPKGERGELATEVLTEIGVARIVPWAASRSIALWKGERAQRSLDRWRSSAREAAKQSRRCWLPEVVPMETTAQVVERVAAATLAIVLHEQHGRPIGSLDVPAGGEIVLVIGPEGGLAPEEVEAFEAAGGVTVRMGAEVLRTSTAGLAAAAAVLSRTPRWA